MSLYRSIISVSAKIGRTTACDTCIAATVDKLHGGILVGECLLNYTAMPLTISRNIYFSDTHLHAELHVTPA